MGLAYPLATDARAALDADDDRFFQTLGEARIKGGERVVLATQWLKPEPDQVDALRDKADAHLGRGFVQIYENADGETVLAVSYWKELTEDQAEAVASESARRKAEAAVEHTTDTYFTKPEERRKRFGKGKTRPRLDPRQLDFFRGPDQQGYETRDPDNPNIVIVDSEGDGTTFGE